MTAAVTTLIMEILTDKYEIPAEDLAETTVFEDVAIDSLALLEMSLILEKRLGVPIAEGVLAGHQTIGEAADVVGSLRATTA